MAAKPVVPNYNHFCCLKCDKLLKFKCSRCKIAHYCSAEHQAEDWPMHKHECTDPLFVDRFTEWRRNDGYPNVDPLQIYPRKRSTDPADKSYGIFAYTHINATTVVVQEEPIIEHVPSSFTEETNWKMLSCTIPKIFNTLSQPVLEPGCSREAEALSIVRHNSMLFVDHRSPFYFLGFAASFFRHSCEPNCAIVHLTRDPDAQRSTTMEFLRIVALRDIKPNEELTISYVESSATAAREGRRETLKKLYGFDCTCSLCMQHESCPSEQNRELLVKFMNSIRDSTIDIKTFSNAINMFREIAYNIYPVNYIIHPAYIKILQDWIDFKVTRKYPVHPSELDMLIDQLSMIQGYKGKQCEYYQTLYPPKPKATLVLN